MNKSTLIFFVLLTTQHNHVKPGISAQIIGGVICTVTVIVGYIKYQESQRSSTDRAIDAGANTLKEIANKVKNSVK